MDAPPMPCLDLSIRPSAGHFTVTPADWEFLGFLFRHGCLTSFLEMESVRDLPYLISDMRLLCSIPNLPIRLVENTFFTLTHLGLATITRSFVNLGFENFLSLSPARSCSDMIERTNSRKKRRVSFETEGFRTIKRRRYLISTEGLHKERCPKRFLLEIPDGVQNLFTPGVHLPPENSTHYVYKGKNLVENSSMWVPTSEKIFGGSNYKETKSLVWKELCHLDQESAPSFQSCPRDLGKIIAEEISNSIPYPKFPLIDSEVRESRKRNIVNLGHNLIAGDLCQLKVEGQMKNSLAETSHVDQAFDEAVKCLNEKLDEVSPSDSRRCGGITPMNGNDTSYDVKTRDEENNDLFLANVRLEAHHQTREQVDNSSTQNPFLSQSIDKDGKKGKERAFCQRMKNGKYLSGSESEQLNIDMSPAVDKQKVMPDQAFSPEQRRDRPMKNRKIVSSISKNQNAQKPFPEFEMFITEKEEGSGGYGTVYRAIRKTDGVTFAIKCPHVGANSKYVQNELKMLERFGGRNFVIKLEGSFESDSGACLILEHVDHDRPEILKREISVIQLQWYGYCLFRALSSLHRKGVVHRDVKPGNFLYSRKVNQGYLIDFNLALDMNKQCSTAGSDLFKPGSSNLSISGAKSLQAGKIRKLPIPKYLEGKFSKSILPPGSLKKKVEKAKASNDASNRSITRSQGADGSGITSAKETCSNRKLSEERFRELIPSKGRKELITLLQEALRCGNHDPANVLTSKRKKVVALPGQVDCNFMYLTPMPLHADGIAVTGARSLTGDKKYKQGHCAGTKGFKAPEVLLRSLYQGTKSDVWSAGVTLLYMMIGRSPFISDNEQNIKEIAMLRGSEDIWEVAKLHNQEALFPVDLLDIKYLSPVKLEDWCAANTRRPDLLKAMPRSFFDLVDKCLMVNPRQRLSAEEALRHDFFAPCHKALRKNKQKTPSL